MAWIPIIAITKIYTDESYDTFQLIRFLNLLVCRVCWGEKSCQEHVHLLNSNIFGIMEFSHCWIEILEYSYVTLCFTFCIDILYICRISLWMLARLSRSLTCHNEVINEGQNKQLFALGTDMDRALLCFVTHAKRYILRTNMW